MTSGDNTQEHLLRQKTQYTMSAVEILQVNGEDTEVGEFCIHSNPDSLEDIPNTMVHSEELSASKSAVFFDRMVESSSNKGSPAKSSSAIRRAASVTGAANEDYKQFAIPGHMSPTISSRRRCVNDTSSLVIVRRKSSKEKEKDSISLPCTMTRPTPRENRACRKRIELSHRNHLDFPHEHYHDDHHNHHHHHHNHSDPGHSHGNGNGHSHGNGNNSSLGVAHSHTPNSHSNSFSGGSTCGNPSGSGSSHGNHSGNNHSSGIHGNTNNNHGNSSHGNTNRGSHSSTNLMNPLTSKSGHGYASEVSAEEYLTPLQRKDQVIRGLKEELKKTQKKLTELNLQMEDALRVNMDMDKVITQKEAEINQVKEDKNQEIGRLQEKMSNAVLEQSSNEEQLREKVEELNDLIRSRDSQAERQLADKRNEILELREKVEELEFNYDELVHVYEESVVNTRAMEKELLALKEELEKREEEHQDMYLAMFQKGKQCHNFERQEELENLGRSDPNQVMVDELITKLENTESKLGRWQTIKTCEIYSDATNRPESEADARLRFLRDSLYHYIMDPLNAMQHLRAMSGIVDFTHAQREQVERVLAQREKGVVKGVKEKLTEKKKVVQFVFKEKREEVLDKFREHRSRRNSHH